MNALVAPFTNLAWPPLASLSRTLVLSLLHRIEVGSLRIVDASVEPKQDIQCGASVKIAGRPHVEVTVRSDAFWVRCLLFADMVCLFFHYLCGYVSSRLTVAAKGLRRELHARRVRLRRPDVLLRGVSLPLTHPAPVSNSTSSSSPTAPPSQTAPPPPARSSRPSPPPCAAPTRFLLHASTPLPTTTSATTCSRRSSRRT